MPPDDQTVIPIPEGPSNATVDANVAAQSKAEATARQQAQDAFAKANAQRAWAASGGDPAQFESQWPAMRAEELRKATASGAEIARENARLHTHRNF
jgi:hypothetical protein